MANEERKAQLSFGVDTSGVKQGVAEIKRDVREMAQDVQQSGQQAAKGIQAIGDGAPAAAQKMDGATKSIVSSIERATAAMQAGEKGSASYFEALAKQRGANVDVLKPYIEQLRQAEEAQRVASGSLGKMGVSAAQTAAALRGLPAQFSDIVVSLQGGQAPLTVFLQQGAQIKDQFGGAGNAVRAMGGYVMGLINPLSVAAAAVAALGVAYYQGAEQANAFARAVIASGGSSGQTATSLSALAQQAGAVTGRFADARSAALELAGVGTIVGGDLATALRGVTAGVEVTGQSVTDLVKDFAELGKEPVQALAKLNEKYGFLTLEVYQQVAALKAQGDEQEAVTKAFGAYADAMASRRQEVVQSLGFIERAWRAIKEESSGALANLQKIGAPQTTGDRIAIARNQLGSMVQTAGPNLLPGTRAAQDIERQRGLIALLEDQEKSELQVAEAKAKSNAAVRAGVELTQEAVKRESDLEKQRRAVLDATSKYVEALSKEGITTQERQQLERDYLTVVSDITKVKEKEKEKSAAAGQSEIATIRAKIKEEEAYIARLRDRGAEASKLTEGERLVAKLQEELTGKLDARTRAAKQLALAEAQRLATVQAQRVEEERSIKSQEQAEAAYRKFLDSIYKGADATRKQAEAQEAANESFGKSKTAIAEMNLEQAKLARDMAKDAGPWTPEYLAAMDAAIDAQERWVRALQAGDLKTINAHTDELLRAAQEQAKLYADESKLAGLTRLEREKIVALRQVELKYAKELAAIDKMPEGDEDQRAAKAAQRAKVEQAKRIEGEAAVSKVIQDNWNRTTDEINRSLTDALLRGFESGKGFAENLRDTLKNMFSTLVLRPVISAIIAPVAGMASGAANGLMGGGAGAAVQAGSSAYNLVSGGLNVASSVGSRIVNSDLLARYGSEAVQEMFGQFGAGMMNTSSWSGFMGAFEAGGANLAGAIAGSVLNGFSGYGISRLISGGYQVNKYVDTIGAIASMIPGVGPIAGVVSGAINRLFGRKLKDQGLEGEFGGDTGFEGRSYQYYKGGLFRSNKTKYGELDGDLRKGLADQFNAMRLGTAAMAEVLGLGTAAIDGFTSSIKISFNGLSEEQIQTKLKEEFDKVAESLAAATLGTTQYSRAGETAVQSITRLSGSLSTVNGVFEQLGATLYKSSLAGADMASQLLDLFGGADKFDAATGTYFQRFYSPEEQREAARKQLEQQLATVDIKLPSIDTTDARAQYRKLVEAQDLNTEAGRKAYAVLVQLAGAFDGIAVAGQDAAAAAQEAARKQQEVADQRWNLEQQILEAEGRTGEALARKREKERAALVALDPSLGALIDRLYGLQDAATAAQEAAAAAAEAARAQQEITDRGRDLEQRLLIAQGKDRQALDLRRLQEYYALLNLNPELARMVIEIYKAEDAAEALVKAQQGREDAYQKLQNAATLQGEKLNAQLQTIDAQRTALGQQRTLADESLALLTGIFDLVRTSARELYGQVESTASMQAAAGWAFVERALETARRTGYLPEQAPLQEAIGAARGGLDARAYATQFEQDRDRLVLAGMLSGLEAIAGPQKTAAERQIEALEAQGKALDLQTEAINKQLKAQQEMLEYWRRQIDIANGTFDATVSVEQAIDKLRESLGMAPDKDVGETLNVKPDRAPVDATGYTGRAVFGGSAYGMPQKPAEVLPRDDYGRVLYRDGSKGPPVDSWFEGTILKWARLSPYNPANVGKHLPPLPAFAVGTNFVPYDTPAIVHKGERIIPAADNRALMAAIDAGQQSGRSERLEALVSQLVAENRQQAGEILRLNARIARVLERWDGDGTPPPREEQTA